ncbi:amidohydrolase family protein [Sphingomonas flavalba]|uniref:amidohydrolase family protein n=1 Tax=Sphingomonas flavalba TaxID=2559804 RepID=UPI00109E017A|nr:amidohydrolase family protein [Sphingomonas flavalba]
MAHLSVSVMLSAAAVLMLSGATAQAQSSYTEADFVRVAKLDAHVHDNVARTTFRNVARKDGFELLSINVDYPDFPPLSVQAQAVEGHHAADPAHFHFATAFSMAGFGEPGWTERAIATIDAAVAKGAVAVKVWKNIGMVAKDDEGRPIFLDDPRFDGVIAHLEKIGLPLIAHQGEPKNCWLPLDQMTTDNDRSYFRDHPQYYMYLHPEEPGYEMLMAARDRFVAFHPKLSFVGAHMASLEWSVDRLAQFLDRFPNANVDLAARMTQVQYQSNADYEKVRAFFVKYQDRLLYGTDIADNPPEPGAPAQNPPIGDDGLAGEADHAWRSDWRYLATPLTQRIADIDAEVKGLALPRAVIDKIYYGNARRIFLSRK